jgi:ornithine cyclodeaminase/alanine dehydrogenase-like protein (mu-crystallin family)
VATKHLARKDAATCGIYGAGKQARTQLLGVSKVRKLTRAVVWSPSEERRTAFARDMSAACGFEVVPAATPEDAARGVDVICTATSAREPVLLGDWLSPGQHVNAIGSNFLAKAEIDVGVVKWANVVTIDSKDQGRLEAGDLVFMGTPAGVGPLQPGDVFTARIDDLPVLHGRIDPPLR